MKNIKFSQIHLEGFGVLQQPVTIPLSTGGMVIMQSDNGTGKSTLFNALLWCLFGRTMKGVTKENLPTWKKYQGHEFKGTLVSVVFFIEDLRYEVIRCINYSGEATTDKIVGKSNLFVYEYRKGKESYRYPGLTTDEVQKNIELLLGMDYELFTKTVFFGQRVNSFSNSSQAEKRDILERLFNLDFIDSALCVAKEQYKRLAEDCKIKITNNTIFESKLTANIELKNVYAEAKKLLQEQREDFIVNAVLNIREVSDNLKVREIKVDSWMQLIKDLEPEEQLKTYQYNEYKASIQEVESSLKLVSEEIGKIGQEVAVMVDKFNIINNQTTEYCFVCGTSYTEEKKQQLLIEKGKIIKEIEKELRAYRVLQVKKQKEYTAYSELLQSFISNIEALKEDLLRITVQKEHLYSLINAEKMDIERIGVQKIELETALEIYKSKTEDTYTEHINLLEEANKQLQNEIMNNKNDIYYLNNELETLKYWIETGFTSKGFKSYMFDLYMSTLNKELKRYSRIFGIGITVTIDAEKASKPVLIYIQRNGKEDILYDSLSGGEKQRVDVCIAFALNDMLSGHNQTNLIILDEITESLDSEGIETVFNFIESKASKDKTVFIATHLSGVVVPSGSTTLQFVKLSEGNTKINTNG